MIFVPFFAVLCKIYYDDYKKDEKKSNALPKFTPNLAAELTDQKSTEQAEPKKSAKDIKLITPKFKKEKSHRIPNLDRSMKL